MEEYFVPRGADQDFIIPVMDANGQPFDLSASTNTIVILYDRDKNVVAKFSVVEGEEWLPLEFGGDANNELSFILPSDKTQAAALEKIFCEVKTLVPDDDLEDGLFDLVEQDIYVCTIVDSMSGGMEIPGT